jgi:multicomponent Na+:H+ antiporter subunit G
MSEWLDTGTWICLLGGSFFGISGAVGLHRFPDFYTRMHATGVTDTLCASLILAGLMLQADSGLVLAKLFLTLFLLLLTAPTATHALAKAARHGNLKPLLEHGEEPPSTS